MRHVAFSPCHEGLHASKGRRRLFCVQRYKYFSIFKQNYGKKKFAARFFHGLRNEGVKHSALFLSHRLHRLHGFIHSVKIIIELRMVSVFQGAYRLQLINYLSKAYGSLLCGFVNPHTVIFVAQIAQMARICSQCEDNYRPENGERIHGRLPPSAHQLSFQSIR